MSDHLHVAFVTPEMGPFVKTGGLADISAALPKALVRLGHRVTVVLPRYASIPFPPGEFSGSVHVPVDGTARSAGFYRTRTEAGVDVVFVEYPPFYDRPVLYGDYEDNRLRFAFLARAALEYFRSRGERPSVFHAHDWQTGLVPVFLKAFYWDDPTLHRTPSVFTIHNVAYQGQFGMDTLGLLGLPWNLGSSFALEYHGSISYLKGGTVFAELVNTVSPTYALEIQGPEHGFGFDGVVRSRAGDVVGILNGVDYDEWDPRSDRHVARTYSPEDTVGQGRLQGRPAAHVRAARVPRPPARRRHVAPRLAEGLRHRGRRVVGLPASAAPDGGAGDRGPRGAGGAAPPPASVTPTASRCASPTTRPSRTR